jgi:hypothetical protein
MRVGAPRSPLAAPKKKHPVAVANSTGETLLVWTEGTGWAKGGSVAWQRFDRDGNALGPKQKASGVPVWSLPTAFARKDGAFEVIY